MTRYTYATCLTWGRDTPTAEVEVEVSFSVAWGSPGTPTPYLGPPEDYDPGSPSVVEDVRLEKVEGKPRPWDMANGFLSDDEFAAMVVDMLDDDTDDMLSAALEAEEARAPD